LNNRIKEEEVREGRGRKEEKHFLFLMQEMGAKTPKVYILNGIYIYVCIYIYIHIQKVAEGSQVKSLGLKVAQAVECLLCKLRAMSSKSSI
jgi:hypothetical protein